MDQRSFLVFITVVCNAIHGVLSSLPWIPDTTVADIQVVSGRVGTLTSVTLNECMLDCYLDITCVTIGYNAANSACQQYNIDLTDFTHNLFGQSNTVFYKGTCPGRPGYAYIRSLHLCIKRYSGQSEPYSDALATCTAEGASLMRLDSNAKKEYFMKTLLHVHDTYADSFDYLIGGKLNNTTWVWQDSDEPITSENGAAYWDTYEPKNATGECVALQANGEDVTMKVVNCAENNMFICSYTSYET